MTPAGTDEHPLPLLGLECLCLCGVLRHSAFRGDSVNLETKRAQDRWAISQAATAGLFLDGSLKTINLQGFIC